MARDAGEDGPGGLIRTTCGCVHHHGRKGVDQFAGTVGAGTKMGSSGALGGVKAGGHDLGMPRYLEGSDPRSRTLLPGHAVRTVVGRNVQRAFYKIHLRIGTKKLHILTAQIE